MHRLLLESADPQNSEIGERGLFDTAERAIRREVSFRQARRDSFADVLLAIANGVRWVTDRPGYSMDPEQASDRFIAAATVPGFVKFDGAIAPARLARAVRLRYPPELLERL